MREHDRSESHDLFGHRDTGWQRGRGTPGRMPVTAHLAPRPASAASAAELEGPTVMRSAEPSAAPASPVSHEDPFGMHLACDELGRAEAGPSAALPEPLREQFGRSLGRDLSDVRLHTDASAARAARSFSAKAVTVGNDIYFAAGAYDPSSSQGQHLLAHEVAHTAQQSAAPSSGSALTVSSPGDACEVEADSAADAMLSGAPATFSPSSDAGRVVMRSPEDGAGGAHSWDGNDDAAEADAREFGSEGTEGQRAGNPEREAAEKERQDSRAKLEDLEVNWLVEAGPGEPVDFEDMPFITELTGGDCPPPVMEAEHAMDWVHAFMGSWDEVTGIHRGVAPHIQAFVGASQMAKQLGLERDANDPKTQGWDSPQQRGGMERYAEEQGTNGKHSVKDMFRGGELDPQFKELDRSVAGFDAADQKTIKDSLLARQQALDGVAKASGELQAVTATTAKAKLLELQGKDLAMDKVKLSVRQAEKEQQIQELTTERDRINGQIGAALAVIDGVASIMKVRNAEAGARGEAAGEALKTTAGVATTLVNLDYNNEINQINTAVSGIKVQMANDDLAIAFVDKKKAIVEYQGWIKAELQAKEAAVRTQYGVYKSAHDAAAAALRAAAVNKTKKEQKERDERADVLPPKDKSKLTKDERAKLRAKDEADQEAQEVAGDRAEAVLRAVAVVDTVLDKAKAGAAVCREPGYSRASGIGFSVVGSPQEILTRVAAIRGYRAGFLQVVARWQARRDELMQIISGHGY